MLLIPKDDVLRFIKANNRWPKGQVKAEANLYQSMHIHMQEDWVFKNEVMDYKGKNKSGNKGKLKGTKTGLHEETLKLARFLMDSGGTGAF